MLRFYNAVYKVSHKQIYSFCTSTDGQSELIEIDQFSTTQILSNAIHCKNRADETLRGDEVELLTGVADIQSEWQSVLGRSRNLIIFVSEEIIEDTQQHS